MDILLEILKDKKKLIAFLLDTIEKSNTEKNGILKLSESLSRDEPNLLIENIAHCVGVTMRYTAKQHHAIQQLAIIALIQCQSSGFDVDVAQMLNKLGKGEEALQQMFKNKLKEES